MYAINSKHHLARHMKCHGVDRYPLGPDYRAGHGGNFDYLR
jgi:hypothetical protein